jgi:hypothetical protein
MRLHHRWRGPDRLARNAWWGPPQLRVTLAGVPTFLASNTPWEEPTNNQAFSIQCHLPVSADQEGKELLSVPTIFFYYFFVRLLSARCVSRGIKSALARMYQRREAPPAGISLGVGGMRVPIDPALRQRLHITQPFGMELLEIRPGGPADQAELKRLDIVIAAEGEPVTEPADVQRIVRRHQAGETVTLSFLRAGNLRKVTVVL